MFSEKTKKIVHSFFLANVILKGLNSLLEIIGGATTFFISKANVNWLAWFITQNELAEDPRDAVANYFLKAASDFSISTRVFTSIYLISHGVIKLLLAWALLKKQLWAYPTAITIFIVFIVYQLYRYSHTNSFLLLLLSGLDLILITLTWLEYRMLKSELAKVVKK